jgi:HEAT repeat protein
MVTTATEVTTETHPLLALRTGLERIIKHLGLSDRGTLLIVTTPDADAETVLADELAHRLSGRVNVRRFRFGDDSQLSLSRHLRTLPHPPGQEALFVSGLDDLSPDDRSDAILALNLGRERLAQAGYSVVLWVRPASLTDLTSRAPDFFSWRSGVFQLDLPSDAVQRQEMVAALRLSASTGMDEPHIRYLDYLIASFRWLDFRGLLQVRNVVRLPLEEVYVPLAGVEYGVRSKEYEVEGTERLPHEAESLYSQPPPPYSRPSTRVDLADALRKHRRVVVLGDPGSGKTTLLKYIVLKFAYACRNREETTELGPVHFPILLSIAGYASARRAAGEPLPILDYLSRYFAELGVGEVEQMIQARLASGRCILLLDGLDEVLSLDERTNVALEVDRLARTYGDNRFLVTSRIAGYNSAPLLADFTPFVIQPFGLDEILGFARQWSRAFEAAGYTSPPPPEAEARAAVQAENLVGAIKSHPAIQKLAANPLLLTLLALIYRQGTRLPHRRVDLYRLGVEALAETWNLARSLSGRPINLYLGERQLDAHLVGRILAPVAFWMHVAQPGGLATRQALEARIAGWFREKDVGVYHHTSEVGSYRDTPLALAHDFLELIREQSGLLVERGLDQFGFMHLTFQEYLAARHVAAQRDPFALVQPHLHDPRWREVILLTAGLLGSFSEGWATDFVRAIRQANSPYEEILHRDLFLACRSLADNVPLAPDLRESLLAQVLALWRETPYRKLREEISDLLAILGQSEAGPRVAWSLLPALSGEDEDTHTRARIAWAVWLLGWTDEVVIQQLQTALQVDDENSWVTSGMATTEGRLVIKPLMGQLDQTDDTVVPKLLIALHHKAAYVRRMAVQGLGRLPRADETAVRGLLVALHDEDTGVRGDAAEVLGVLGRADKVVAQALLSVLSDEDAYVRACAAEALGRLGWMSHEVAAALLSALRDKSNRVRAAAAWALARLGQTEPAVLRSLWRLLSLKRSREVILYPNWKTKDLEWTQGPAYDAFFAALWTLVEKLAADDGRE